MENKQRILFCQLHDVTKMRIKCFVTLILLVTADCKFNNSVQRKKRATEREDIYLSTPQLIEKYEYPVEVHQVETQDGYILAVHRIPYGRKSGPTANKPVAFVLHGLLASSADWVIAGPENGLGYILADNGYDVWMGNSRGNTYSKKHTKLTPRNTRFWDFSWHEIGIYDLPAMIDYVLERSGQQQVYYIGHSQGTTAFFVMCSEKPEYNAKIKVQFSLAPIAYMSHMTSPLLQIIASFKGPIEVFLKRLGIYEFLPSTELMAEAGKVFCAENSLTQIICTNSMFIVCGFSTKEMNTELLPVIMGHTPAGSSTKQFLHYAQEINSGQFRQWDYGLLNMVYYKSVNPPKYDLRKVTAPVALFYSHNDWLAAEVDVLRLYDELPNTIGRFLVTDKNFNHLDYMWGKDVVNVVYNKVLALMTRS